MSTVCCNSDPSCPVIPGGASRIFEWSLHGGAAVESIIMLGSRCPLIFSASSLGSTSQMSPIYVWFMSKVSLKIEMHVSSISHQKVCKTVKGSVLRGFIEGLFKSGGSIVPAANCMPSPIVNAIFLLWLVCGRFRKYCVLSKTGCRIWSFGL